MLNPEDLQERIRLGEDSHLELKEVRFTGDRLTAPDRKTLADELAAFANGQGGVCLLGVDDQRAIIGVPLERLDLVEKFVFEICSDSIEPPLAPLIERHWLTNDTGQKHPILAVAVGRSLFVHRSPGGYLLRVGSSKRLMSTEYLARLFQQRSQTRLIRFDEQPIPRANLDDLEPALWQRFATPRTQDPRETMLVKLAMARADEDGHLRPSVAGVLMACKEPRQWLAHAFIQAVAYRGTEIMPDANHLYQIDAADFAGPLDSQIIEAWRFVMKNMRVGAYKTGAGRVDVPQFDSVSIFEAIANAVAHRDYSIYGSKIRLRLFEDRLELYSPGGLPNTMTVDSLAYRQAARNEALTSLLARCPVPVHNPELLAHRAFLMDKRGEGVALLLDQSERLSGRRPVYRLIDESELQLTIYAAGVEN